jgi:hypothetical protein
LGALLCAAGAQAAADTMFVKVFPERGALTISLHDDLRSPIYNWPRTLLTYPVDFSNGPIGPNRLRLSDGAGHAIPFQVSGIRKAPDGRIVFASVSFFSALEPGATHEFRLETGEPGAPEGGPAVRAYREGRMRVVDSGALKVRLPASQEIAKGEPVPGPLVALNRGQGWIGTSRLLAGRGQVRRIEAAAVETGALFDLYRVAYLFVGGAKYEATVKSVLGYPFVELEERMSGLGPEAQAAVEMDWTGFAPARRFAANGWAQPKGYLGIEEPVATPGILEEPHWIAADRVEDPHREMFFHLAAFEGNAPRDAVPAMSFWETGSEGQELGVFVPDTRDWDDRQYMIWQPTTLLQVAFRFAGGHLVWHWPLASGRRRTGISLASAHTAGEAMRQVRETYAAEAKGFTRTFVDASGASAGSSHQSYAEWLRAWYGGLDLNRVKDWVLSYPANLRQAPAPLWPAGATASKTSASDYENQVFHSSLMNYPLGSDVGVMNINHRTIRPFVEEYMRLRESFTPRQKARIDALLLLSAYMNAGEDLAPVRVCLTGTPNMSADGFAVPAEIGILYPDHQMNPEWRDQFEKIIRLQAMFYTRPDVPEYQALGGRWAESLSVYNWAYLLPALTAQVAIAHTDGSNRLANREMAQRARWMVDELSAPVYNPNPYWRQADPPRPPPASPWQPEIALTPAHGFERQYPAHGAHGSGTGIVVPYDVPILAKYLRNYDPLTAEYLLWAYAQRTSTEQAEGNEMFWRAGVLDELKGNSGTNPHLRSSRYTGHGIILRAGVGTPGEVSVHLDQTDQGPNYRWGDNGEGSSGVLYFFANGQPWSGHERENTGDHSNDDATGTTTFAVLQNHTWKSIGENVLDRPLYDLEVAQFGEIAARKDHVPYSWPTYRSRSVMLVGTDYMILGDDVLGADERAETRFSWFTAKDLPFPKMVFLEPLSARVDHWTQVSTQMSKGILRDAAGPGIVLVTHKKDEVEMEHMRSRPLSFPEIAKISAYSWDKGYGPDATPGVYFVRTATSHDRVFRNFAPVRYSSGGEEFSGMAGVIRSRAGGVTEMAIFEGETIGARGVRLRLEPNSETGIGARIDASGYMAGIYDARAETRLTLGFPAAAGAAYVAYIDGARAEQERNGGGLTVKLRAGRHRWELTQRAPTPPAPSVLRTVNGRSGARVFFAETAGSELYRLEVSEDQATSWKVVRTGKNSPLSAEGLRAGTKVHVRIAAVNSDGREVPGPEYPVYVSGLPPSAPDGLELELAAGRVRASWGEVLGASEYRLYRRAAGQNAWSVVCRGLARQCEDHAEGVTAPAYMPGRADNALHPAAGPIYEYAVSAADDNGEGSRSRAVTTDPAGWAAWWPSGVERKFRRQTGFWLPPYVPAEMTPPLYYPEKK